MNTIRCSSLPRLSLCPASQFLGEVAESKGLEPVRPADLAAAGTEVHRILEEEVNAHGIDVFGVIATDKSRDTTLRILAARTKHLLDTYMRDVDSSVVQVSTEVYFETPGYLSGHVDLLVTWFNEDREYNGIVIDYKSGWLETPKPSKNKQLLGYCVLAMEHIPALVRVLGAIIPVVGDVELPVELYRSADSEVSAKAIIEKIIRDVSIEATHLGPVPGPEQCKYCPAYGCYCQASRTELQKIDASIGEAITNLEDSTLNELYERCAAVLVLKDTIKGEITRRLSERPDDEPGDLAFKQQLSIGNYVLHGADAAQALQDWGIGAEDIGFELKLDKLADAIHSKDPGPSKVSIKRRLEEQYASVATLPKPRVSLVRAKRSRT